MTELETQRNRPPRRLKFDDVSDRATKLEAGHFNVYGLTWDGWRHIYVLRRKELEYMGSKKLK